MSKHISFAVLALILGGFFPVFAQEISPGDLPKVESRVETPDQTFGEGLVNMAPNRLCTITGEYLGKPKTGTYPSNRAICVFDALSKEDGFTYTVEFSDRFARTGLLTRMEKNGVVVEDDIWFVINNLFPDNTQCANQSISITECWLSDRDELMVFSAGSSFVPFLGLEVLTVPPLTTATAVQFRVVNLGTVPNPPMPNVRVQCGSFSATTNAQGIASLMIPESGNFSCVAEDGESVRSQRVSVTIELAPPQDQDPPAEDPPQDQPDQGNTPDTDNPGSGQTNPPDNSAPVDPQNPPSQDPTPTPPSNDLPPSSPSPTSPENPGSSAPDQPQDQVSEPEKPAVRMVSVAERRKMAQKALAFLTRLQNADGVIRDEQISAWAAMAFAGFGRSVFDVHHGGPSLDHALVDMDVLHADALTLSRHILALRATGRNNKNPILKNTCEQLSTFWNEKIFGSAKLLNDDIFGLLAARVCGYSSLTSSLRTVIVQQQNADGGFGINVGGRSNADMTAAAIQALRKDIAWNVAGARTYLASTQAADGGFGYVSGAPSNTASTAWAVQAIVALGEDPNTWQVQEKTPWIFLESMQNSDGSFGWMTPQPADPLMSAYAASALAGAVWPVAGKNATVPVYQEDETAAFASEQQSGDVSATGNDLSGEEQKETETVLPSDEPGESLQKSILPHSVIESVAAAESDEAAGGMVLGATASASSKKSPWLDLVLFVTLVVVLESLAFWVRVGLRTRRAS